jgi:hypothetical protein
VADLDTVHNSAGRMRIRSEGTLARGQWAVIDLPGLEVHGEELHMRAADDLAGCALIVCALTQIAKAAFPVDVTGVFTRAEETGLYGARVLAEDGEVARDAFVISVAAGSWCAWATCTTRSATARSAFCVPPRSASSATACRCNARCWTAGRARRPRSS